MDIQTDSAMTKESVLRYFYCGTETVISGCPSDDPYLVQEKERLRVLKEIIHDIAELQRLKDTLKFSKAVISEAIDGQGDVGAWKDCLNEINGYELD